MRLRLSDWRFRCGRPFRFGQPAAGSRTGTGGETTKNNTRETWSANQSGTRLTNCRFNWPGIRAGKRRPVDKIENLHPEVKEALQPLRHRLTLVRLAALVVTGLIAGVAVACLLLIAARIVPWAHVRLWVAVVVAAGPVAAGLWAWYRRPGYWETARCADGLGLAERVTTALELGNSVEPVAVLQRTDAMHCLQSLPVAEKLPVRVNVQQLRVLAATVIVAAGLLFWPNPLQTVAEHRERVADAIDRQEERVEEIRRDVAGNSTLSPALREQIDQVLAQLKKELKQADSPGKALESLSRAEQNLAAVSQGNEAVGMLKSVAWNLSSHPAARNLGDRLASRDTAAIKTEIAKLTDALKSMDAAEKKELAQALAAAADSAAAHPDLAAALAEASRAVSGEALSSPAAALANLGEVLTAAGQLAASEVLLAELQSDLREAGQVIAAAANASGSAAVCGPEHGSAGGGDG